VTKSKPNPLTTPPDDGGRMRRSICQSERTAIATLATIIGQAPLKVVPGVLPPEKRIDDYVRSLCKRHIADVARQLVRDGMSERDAMRTIDSFG
jgi:hypothetical protein